MAAAGDGDLAGGLSRSAATLLHSLDDLRASDNLHRHAAAMSSRQHGGSWGRRGGRGRYLAEDDVLAIKMGSGHSGDEELAAVGVGACDVVVGGEGGCVRRRRAGVTVREEQAEAMVKRQTSIGHGEEEWHGVLVLEVLVGELLAVDALA